PVLMPDHVQDFSNSGKIFSKLTPEFSDKHHERTRSMKTITKFINAVFAVVIFAIGALTANADPGDIFVSDVANNVIYKVAPDGTPSIFATGLNIPEGLAFDSAGNLFEADYGSNTIYKF